MTHIGVIGAGAAGTAAAFELDRECPDADVTVLEKSAGVSGRAATRQRDGLTYDYGANYVRSDDDRVVEILTETLDAAGLVDVVEPVYVFDEAGSVSPGEDRDDRKWTYRSGIAQVGQRLLARTDARLHLETRVRSLARESGSWRVEDEADRTWGPFEYLVVTPPAPQTATLLAQADWAPARRDPVAEAVAAVDYRTIWSAALHYPFDLDRPYYALLNTDRNHQVSWISREECKPGHVPDGESLLIVQASHDWSVARADASPADNAERLATLTANVVGDQRLAAPDWTDHQRWRYALTEGAVATGPRKAAEADGLYLAGDWVAGEARVHAAIRSGLEAGDRIAATATDRC